MLKLYPQSYATYAAHQPLPPQIASISVHLFSVRVLGGDPVTLITNGSFPAWKWTKPDSGYLLKKQGLWKPDLEDIILNGEECVGRGLHLLMQGVSAERKEELRERMVIFPTSN
jgi:hypothetical protein